MEKIKEQQHTFKSRKPSIANISGIMGVSLICLFSVTGCDWFGNKSDDEKIVNEGETVKPENKKTEDSNVHLEPVANADSACSGEKVKDGLQKSVQTYISQQSNTLATTYAKDAKVTLDSNKINTDGVTVLVENTKASSKQTEGTPINCHATIKMTLSDEDITRANQLYADNNGKSLQQRLAGSSLTLEGNTLVDENFSFTVDPNTSGSLPTISGQPLVVGAVAGVLANSAIKASKPLASSTKKTVNPQPTKPKAATQNSVNAKQKAEARRKANIAKKRRQAKIAKQKAEAKRKADVAKKKRQARVAKQKAAAEKAKKKDYSLANDGLSASENAAKTKAAFKAKENSPKVKAPTTKIKVTPKASTVNKKTATVKNNKIEMVIEEENDTY